MTKEATARIKISKLLEAAGWRKPSYDNMRELHEGLRTKYGSDDACGAALSAALPPSRDCAAGEDHGSHGSIDMLDSEAASAVMPPPHR